MNKSYILLRMYDDLRLGKKVAINECCTEFKISVSTFRRYMAFLRAYFAEVYAQEIVYDAEHTEYRVRK